MSGFQAPITIKQAIDRINRNDYLVPSFQREFVWTPDQIEQLFDSLMRGYPINSMLFWRIDNNKTLNYRFYTLLKKYIQDHRTHNDIFNTNQISRFSAILDGQQRMTSLYIGLCGSYAYKKHYARKENNETNYPTRRLYLNLSKVLAENEDRMYDFDFKEDTQTVGSVIYIDQNGDKHFKASEILKINSISDIRNFSKDHDLTDEEESVFSKLWEVISVNPVINYYEEDTQDPDKAVNIFVRINSGGTQLSFSDILFSLTVASWQQIDARTQIAELVDSINNLDFRINKDLVLRVFLVLFKKNIKFQLKNFDSKSIALTEENWNDIRDCIYNTFILLSQYGFNSQTLTSNNAVLPIIFYLYYYTDFRAISTSHAYEELRGRLIKWLLKALIHKSFGGSSDEAITNARKPMLNNGSTGDLIEPTSSLDTFPADQISNELGHYNISDEIIRELLNTQYNDRYAFSILALLYPNLDYRNNNFHKDHLHPASKWLKNNSDHSWEVHNSILNLQMLDANENQSKNDKDLIDWVNRELAKGKDRSQFYDSHLIPDVNLSYSSFNDFIGAREEMLMDKLRSILK